MTKLIKFEVGDPISYADHDYGIVLEVMPKGKLVIARNRKDQELVVDVSDKLLSLVDIGKGYRLINDDEVINKTGDEYYGTDGWTNAPSGYKGDRYMYFFRRKK